jgi:hypothetical protein
VECRRNVHFSMLRRGVHDNRHLQHAFSRYGESSFEFSVLLICEEVELLIKEQDFIDEYKSADRSHGYNIWPTANRTVQSDEQRANLSKSHMGHRHPPEVRAKISAALRVRVRRPESIEKVSRALTGRKLSPEHIAKWKAAQTFGPLTAEHKKKISDGNRGRVVTAETRRKIGAANKGKALGKPSWNKGIPMRDESRHKLSNSLKGRVAWNKGLKGVVGGWNKGRRMSEQARANMSAARTGRACPARQKAVVQIDPKNGIVAIYDSITAASQATGARNIGQCCRGKWETSKGYAWNYADEERAA